MAGTPEEDLLDWLEREEEELGFDLLADSMSDYGKARDTWLNEIGRDLSRDAFDSLSSAFNFKYNEVPQASATLETRTTYRDISGRFTSKENAVSTTTQYGYRDLISGRLISAEDVFAILRGEFQ